MPKSILDKVVLGVQASREYIAHPPVDRVVASPINSEEEYKAIP